MEVIGGLAGVITHSAAAVSCTGPGATCSGSWPRLWTVDPSLTAAGDTGRCSTGHWSLHVPAVCQCAAGGAAQSSEAAAG